MEDNSAIVVFGAIAVVLVVLTVIGMWKVFQKAGKPGWAAIVPIYNLWVAFEIAGKPGWWALLVLIPYLGGLIVTVMEIIAFIEIAKRFGKSAVFGFFGLFLFSFVGWPMLGFGDAKYQGGGAAPAAPAPTPTEPATPAQ